MTPRIALSLLILLACANPDHAAGDTHGTEDPVPATGDATGPAEAVLPQSMLRHGVIGHIALPSGVALFDSGILKRMRLRLIMLSQKTGK